MRRANDQQGTATTIKVNNVIGCFGKLRIMPQGCFKIRMGALELPNVNYLLLNMMYDYCTSRGLIRLDPLKELEYI